MALAEAQKKAANASAFENQSKGQNYQVQSLGNAKEQLISNERYLGEFADPDKLNKAATDIVNGNSNSGDNTSQADQDRADSLAKRFGGETEDRNDRLANLDGLPEQAASANPLTPGPQPKAANTQVAANPLAPSPQSDTAQPATASQPSSSGPDQPVSVGDRAKQLSGMPGVTGPVTISENGQTSSGINGRAFEPISPVQKQQISDTNDFASSTVKDLIGQGAGNPTPATPATASTPTTPTTDTAMNPPPTPRNVNQAAYTAPANPLTTPTAPTDTTAGATTPTTATGKKKPGEDDEETAG